MNGYHFIGIRNNMHIASIGFVVSLSSISLEIWKTSPNLRFLVPKNLDTNVLTFKLLGLVRKYERHIMKRVQLLTSYSQITIRYFNTWPMRVLYANATTLSLLVWPDGSNFAQKHTQTQNKPEKCLFYLPLSRYQFIYGDQINRSFFSVWKLFTLIYIDTTSC